MPYTLHNDFDHNTAYGARCTVCGNIRQARHKGVFRPQVMDDFDGFHDICEDCVTQAASELGHVQPKVAKSMTTKATNLRNELAEAQSLYIESQNTIRTLCKENANLQELVNNLAKPVELVE